MYGVTTYPVMVDPPLLAGAVHDTDADPTPPVAVPIAGAPGVLAGTTEFEALDGFPVPTPFVADTLKVYAVPRVSPVTVVEVTVGPLRLV